MRKIRFGVFLVFLCSTMLGMNRGVFAYDICDEQYDACNQQCGGNEYWDYVNHMYRWDASSTEYWECDPYVQGGTGAVCACIH